MDLYAFQGVDPGNHPCMVSWSYASDQ